jgi:hypothetical protein
MKQGVQHMATPTQSEIVAAVREHANKNYNKGGWDIIVECWSDADILEATEGARSINGAIRKVKGAAGIMGERRREIQAEIW